MPDGTLAGIVVVHVELSSIILPSPQYPANTVPEMRPDSSILNQFKVSELTPVQVVPPQLARYLKAGISGRREGADKYERTLTLGRKDGARLDSSTQ